MRRCGFDVPASVVVADDFAVPLEHELGNASAVDTPLGTFVVLLHPVVKNLALVLAMLSAVFIVCRTLSNRSHHEKWKDYDECGI